MKNYLMLCLIFIFGSAGFAEVDLIVWQSGVNAPKIVLPRLDDESLTDAVQKYLTSLFQNQNLKSVVRSNYQFSKGYVSELKAENINSH
jgi:hypothetical protein